MLTISCLVPLHLLHIRCPEANFGLNADTNALCQERFLLDLLAGITRKSFSKSQVRLCTDLRQFNCFSEETE